ncbi:MAG: hypothetical protein UU08_C0009G0027 [Candidatus Uhrbacteria bacterium GW2011_GWE2_40_58]|nr:MAG: hypothetical protein UT94_C0030G0009 [Candidatus Uhrbacteria bacterium GW2011_GWF2_40_263]KKR67765.1 MAG: hypothetical protein UU08_C0009G0027 [Candidatus Uhrbacteria bacterium GW2011_GWE2_40_58]OGL92205.1 MAG: hypothetical protein A2239_03055 [Candidatus Uhrbacteria bacterium RIFOXYA2_FULL_40_9]OGL96740.1 MAG: hypothetical protein A2332_00475 [Candidatus Uhrbacteria bacterium RIFOXYB2_FULL_41_18]HBK35286.1 hypothetical protein [Candidatus Uhrbacteria bacterium]
MIKRISTLFLLFTLLITLGLGCNGSSEAERLANTPVTLTIWRVFDDDSTFTGLMTRYRALHPNVSFSYRELRYDEYQDELLQAFAEGTGPDIFSLHNTWIGQYKNLLLPMPETVTIPYSEERGSIKKEIVYTLVEDPTMSTRELETKFIDVVAGDVIRNYQATTRSAIEEKIYGLPLSVDTLVLFYNKDLLNAAGIAEPAITWNEFQDQVAKLTLIDRNNNILQAGAALGTSENVERSFDILSLLMMQNGTEMTGSRGTATFGTVTGDISPGMQAVTFYTDFANPLKQVYTWNDEQTNSFDAFVSGQAAYFFGYSYHLPLIEAVAEKLNYSTAPIPQIEGGQTVNYANYWVEGVAKATDHEDWAWDFILYATDEKNVTSYLSMAKRPTALRSLVNNQLDDEDLTVFASQLLTAKSWYQGNDAGVTEEAFAELIDNTISGKVELSRAIKDAQNKVNQTY